MPGGYAVTVTVDLKFSITSMIRAAISLRLRPQAVSIGRPFRPLFVPTLSTRTLRPKYFHDSSCRATPTTHWNQSFDGEDKLELVDLRRDPPKDFTGSKSIHVSRVQKDVSDEEFRKAFAFLDGLEKTELVFNSGALRDYRDTASRGFGFLHFKDEESALAASKVLQENPVRFRGYEVQINPYKTIIPTVNEKSHTLHISGVPLDLQYLEILEYLKEKNLQPKSIRFMTTREQNFVGAVNVVFEDIESAVKAREEIISTSLGGTTLRENDVKFGRPLWEDGPTTTLMIIGIAKQETAVRRMRQILASLDGVTRYKLSALKPAP
ncbi:RNA recognition motif protein [Ceratobasidium sp. AG-Ba]|nr:RNA recognition motif protein [Ceratobasidium sp. AG-Ba]QRW09724.1 RNA recognition motif protein [Ceratobasidium sp. AG-Ba]